ncbi:MAG: NADH-quinone oxidoreductase subunit J [Pirellulaceae bacterium]
MMQLPLLLAQASGAPAAESAAADGAANETAALSAAWLSNLACPLLWSLIVGGIGLWLLLPSAVGRFRRTTGWLLMAVSLGLLAAYLPRMGDTFHQILFWTLAGATLLGAIATISMRSPVYSAVWFALTLLTTAGLLLFQQAQFLAVATIAVYAGAILVMFLFVLMLAQPEGHTFYDRITWGPFATTFAVLSAVAIIGGMTYEITHLDDQLLTEHVAAGKPELGIDDGATHMAGLGRVLFSQHLISVEVAGTLLLAALVGALAIVIHGRPSRAAAAIRQGGATHG